MHAFLRQVACLVLGGLLWSSCSLGDRLDQLELPPYRPEVAAPIVTVALSPQALLNELRPEDSLLSTGPNGLITLRYTDTIYSVGAESYLRLDDISVPVTQPQASIPIELLGNQALAVATLASGHLAYEIELPQPGSYDLILSLPDAQLAGKLFTYTQPIDGDRYEESGLSLAGYRFSFPDGTLHFSYQLRDRLTGQAVSPQRFSLTLGDLSFSYVEGRLGDFLLRQDLKTTAFDALDGFQAERFELGDARLSFIADNSFGVPVAFRIGHFRAYNRLGEQVDIVHDQLNQGIAANFPPLEAVGQSRRTLVTLSRDNTNLDDFTSLFPNAIELGWDVRIASQGSQENYFVTADSRVDFSLETELPLAFRARNLVYEGRHEGSFAWPEVDQVSEMTLKLVAENGLPFDASLQLYFEDDQGHCLDSLGQEMAPLLAAAPTDARGEATGIQATTHYVAMDAQRYLRLREASSLRYRLRIDGETAQGQAIRLLGTDILTFRLGVVAALNMGE